MTRIEIKIGGIGGQGVIYAADLLGLAASQVYHAVAVSASYGAEARGTFTTAEVVISKEDIDYPHVELPNYLVLMHQKAYDVLLDKTAPDGRIIIDNYLIKNIVSGNHRYFIPATQLARDKFADITMANLILVGGLVRIAGLFDSEVLFKAYKFRLKGKSPKVLNKGLKALQLGMDYNT